MSGILTTPLQRLGACVAAATIADTGAAFAIADGADFKNIVVAAGLAIGTTVFSVIAGKQQRQQMTKDTWGQPTRRSEVKVDFHSEHPVSYFDAGGR